MNDRNEPAWSRELLDAPHDVPDKAARVRHMFNSVAATYEFINALFSLGRDAYWRRRAVELADVSDDDDVLDVACGTGDFARAFAAGGARRVVGCDFAHEMLIRATRAVTPGSPRGLKPAARGTRVIGCNSARVGARRSRRFDRCDFARAEARDSFWVEADALRLPFHSGSYSITSCAFGVRNFEDLGAGLAEMFRILRPGGRAVILEFTRPRNRLFRRVFEFYASRLMPLAATLIARDQSGAYRYLPRSVVSFVDAEQMCARLRRAGFKRAAATPLTMGIVTVYVATRA